MNSKFSIGDKVEKYTGDYTASGEVRAVYITTKEALRYVVEIHPQGLQMIFTEAQLRWSVA